MKDCSDQFLVEDEDAGPVAHAEIRVANVKGSLGPAAAQGQVGRNPALTQPHAARASSGKANRPTSESEAAAEVLDAHKLAQRQKQIDFGKNTLGYQRYLKAVPKHQRTKDDPKTPNIYLGSKRGFEGLVKIWRRKLHQYDEGAAARDQGPASAQGGRLADTLAAVPAQDTEEGGAMEASAQGSPARSIGSLDGYLPPPRPLPASVPAPVAPPTSVKVPTPAPAPAAATTADNTGACGANRKRTFGSATDTDVQADQENLRTGGTGTAGGRDGSAEPARGSGLLSGGGRSLAAWAREALASGEPEPKRSAASKQGGAVCNSMSGLIGPCSASNPSLGATSGCQAAGTGSAAAAGAPLGVLQWDSMPSAPASLQAEVSNPGNSNSAAGLGAGTGGFATSFAGLSASVSVAAAGVTGVRSARNTADEDNVVALILGGDGASCMSWQSAGYSNQ